MTKNVFPALYIDVAPRLQNDSPLDGIKPGDLGEVYLVKDPESKEAVGHGASAHMTATSLEQIHYQVDRLGSEAAKHTLALRVQGFLTNWTKSDPELINHEVELKFVTEDMPQTLIDARPHFLDFLKANGMKVKLIS